VEELNNGSFGASTRKIRVSLADVKVSVPATSYLERVSKAERPDLPSPLVSNGVNTRLPRKTPTFPPFLANRPPHPPLPLLREQNRSNPAANPPNVLPTRPPSVLSS
jgi:hypothetical protein